MEKTCAELINEKKNYELKTVKETLKSNSKTDNYLNDVLCYMKKIIINVQLSWGGPANGYKFHIVDNKIVSIYYYYQDWFDYAEIELEDKEFNQVNSLLGESVLAQLEQNN